MQKIDEGILSRTADLFYAFKFLKLLTTSWDKTEAFEKGLIDNKGKLIKKPQTADEKSAYTVFNRLVFNIKRLIPGNKIGSYAAALFLIKEHTGISENKIRTILEEATGEKITDQYFNENKWFETDSGINPGTYTLIEDAISPLTGEVIALKNTKIIVKEKALPCSHMFGKSIYKVTHIQTNQEIYISNGDIKR
tara:strand:+ start:3299 stop:3880 length:582 start_codon:yes stop_codon:yes gene_type:complete